MFTCTDSIDAQKTNNLIPIIESKNDLIGKSKNSGFVVSEREINKLREKNGFSKKNKETTLNYHSDLKKIDSSNKTKKEKDGFLEDFYPLTHDTKCNTSEGKKDLSNSQLMNHISNIFISGTNNPDSRITKNSIIQSPLFGRTYASENK